jgi:hypothetical protein
MKRVMAGILFILQLFGNIFGCQIDTLKLYSDTLKELREIIVFKPDGYHSGDSISVIYFLDGESSVYLYRGLEKNSSNKYLGIGIVNTDRRRDLLVLKEAGKFLSFINDEVIPSVEKELLIKERILFGHSFGGAFVIYTMINRPGAFNRYIAASPTPIMMLTDPDFYQQLDSILDHKIRFLHSYGSRDMKQVIRWCDELDTSLSGISLKNIAWERTVLEGLFHDESGLLTLLRGIQ